MKLCSGDNHTPQHHKNLRAHILVNCFNCNIKFNIWILHQEVLSTTLCKIYHIYHQVIFQRLIQKDVMLTNPCFYVFGDVLCVLRFYCTYFQAIICTFLLYTFSSQNVYSKNVVHKTHCQVHNNIDL